MNRQHENGEYEYGTVTKEFKRNNLNCVKAKRDFLSPPSKEIP